MVDYNAAAELYFGRRGIRARKTVGYRRFSNASDAVLFAVEQLEPTVLASAMLEIDEDRFNAVEIRELYDSADFPLGRKAPQ